MRLAACIAERCLHRSADRHRRRRICSVGAAGSAAVIGEVSFENQGRARVMLRNQRHAAGVRRQHHRPVSRRGDDRPGCRSTSAISLAHGPQQMNLTIDQMLEMPVLPSGGREEGSALHARARDARAQARRLEPVIVPGRAKTRVPEPLAHRGKRCLSLQEALPVLAGGVKADAGPRAPSSPAGCICSPPEHRVAVDVGRHRRRCFVLEVAMRRGIGKGEPARRWRCLAGS
mgnify:CR=1 FL=1